MSEKTECRKIRRCNKCESILRKIDEDNNKELYKCEECNEIKSIRKDKEKEEERKEKTKKYDLAKKIRNIKNRKRKEELMLNTKREEKLSRCLEQKVKRG